MDKRTILAVTLCFLIFFFWQKVYVDPQVNRNRVEKTATPVSQTVRDTKPVLAKPALKPKSEKVVAEQFEKIVVSNGEVTMSNRASLFEEWTLNQYGKANVSLTNTLHDSNNVRLAFDDPQYAYLMNVRGKLIRDKNSVRWIYEDENITVQRQFTYSPQEPFLDGSYEIVFKGPPAKYAFLTLDAAKPIEDDHDEMDRQVSFSMAGEVERSFLRDSVENKFYQTPTRWMMAMGNYFGVAVVAKSEVLPFSSIRGISANSRMGSLVYPIQGNSISIPLRVYFGSKELEILRKVDRSLDHAVDFGWFTFIAYPILQFMRFLYRFIHNYGVAIIIMTLLLKVLTYPLTLKSMKSMKQMAKLQPQIQKIREKYKSEPQKMNQEMIQFMRSNGYNPMSGCLPILIQMPVFIALYNVLRSSVELYQAPFALWITDLSVKDPFYVTPVLLTLAMYVSQKLTPMTATDPMQQKMMQFMPVIFGVMMVTLPSGLTLYMLANSVAGIFQQMILNKKLDVGHVTPAIVSR